MALTNNEYTGNGTNKLFSITFPYLDTTDIDVYINSSLTTAYTFANATTIEFTTAPANGAKILIQRTTANDENKATFFAGSSVRASDLNVNFDQGLYVRQELDETTWDRLGDTIDSVETWISSDDYIGTTAATVNEMDLRHDTLVQTGTPGYAGWQVGKTWLQNDVNKTLSIWDGTTWVGVASGGTFTTQPSVIYVDSLNGDDANDGHRIINPKKTIKNAVASANAGDIVRVVPGVYQEILPIDITVDNLSIVGDAQRSCFVHPTPATETEVMFRCNSGTYIDGFTFAGLKASGPRGGNAVDSDPTYGLPTNQGWVAGFYPGCIIRKSPFINNATNFADASIDNSNFNPNNYSGTGGDLTSAPTGGGIIVDGSLPSVSSPLRSFVINEFTQVCLDGPGLLVCNNGYAQAVSFFGLFCHYHAKALSGGQINMEVGTTDFGRYGLIADGKSTAPIFTATANGAASANDVTFSINAPVAGGTWFGDANRPAINMLVQIGSDLYPILSSSPNGTGWYVTISRPNPSNRAENLGLINGHANGATVSFYLRSMVSTASHTMEYAGSGTDYTALPENGGVPNETNESINLNNGRVWLTSTDQSGKFKVGDTFQVDQQTGFVTIDPQSYATNLVSDLTPQLGGDLDVLNKNIYSSMGDIGIQDAFNTGADTLKVREFSLPTAYPFVTQYDIGTSANQVPLNQYLGTMAFQDSAGVNIDQASITQITNVPLLTGGGLKFPATQVASADANTLDDYEEGTWTPTQGSGLTVVGTFSSSGRYTKIGKIVTLEAYLSATTSLTLSGTGSSIICGGVPFPPAGTPTGDARCNGVAINEAITASTSVQISQFSIYNAQTMAATNNIRITITYGTV